MAVELNERTTRTTHHGTRYDHVPCRPIQRLGHNSINDFGDDHMILPMDGTIWEPFDDHRTAIRLSMQCSDLEKKTCYGQQIAPHRFGLKLYTTTPSIAFTIAPSIFASIASNSSAVHVTRMLKLMSRLMTASLLGKVSILRSCGRPSSWATSL